jgi:hypothetical protein
LASERPEETTPISSLESSTWSEASLIAPLVSQTNNSNIWVTSTDSNTTTM